jgi:hypothetical protein
MPDSPCMQERRLAADSSWGQWILALLAVLALTGILAIQWAQMHLPL